MFPSITKKSGSINYHLTSDKEVEFSFSDWPITWTGMVNSKEVTVVQTNYRDDSEYYEFSTGITEDERYKLIKAIDMELKVVLD